MTVMKLCAFLCVCARERVCQKTMGIGLLLSQPGLTSQRKCGNTCINHNILSGELRSWSNDNDVTNIDVFVCRGGGGGGSPRETDPTNLSKRYRLSVIRLQKEQPERLRIINQSPFVGR